ncbi:MAG TPA: AAA family ATPase [Thermoanaerobaculia bacterium]
MTDIDNLTFLSALFGPPDTWNGPTHVFTASFAGDPNLSRGFHFSPVLPAAHNNYFAVSRFRSRSRRIEEWAELAVLVIDDVVAKVEPDLVRERLGEPTYRLETSLDNEQWGYALVSPERDLGCAHGLVQAACRVFGLDDMAGVNRLVRLPVGRNGKAAARGFRCRLLEWEPSRRFRAAALAERLGAGREEPGGRHQGLEPAPLDQDPVWTALVALDMVRGEAGASGWIPILCPWHDEHTGRAETGTSYHPPSGFRCHHGHCARRTFADLRGWLGVSSAEVDAGPLAQWAAELVDSGAAPSAAQLAPPVEGFPGLAELDAEWTGDDDTALATALAGGAAPAAAEAELRAALAASGVLLSHELRPVTRTDYIVRGLVHEGEGVMLYGDSGTLKTQVAVSLGLSLAAGQAWWDRPTRGGAALIVAAEGARGLRNRVTAQRRALGLADEADIPFALLPRPVNLFARGADAEEAFVELGKAGKRLERLYGVPLRLLVFDTLHQNSAGAEENSAKDFGLVYARVRTLLGAFPRAAVAVVHHKGKAIGADYRGSGAMRNDFDVLLDCAVVGAGDGPLEGRVLRLTTDKVKDARDDQVLGYRAGVAVVGVDDEGVGIEAPFVVGVSEAQLEALESAADGRHWLVRLVERMVAEAESVGAGRRWEGMVGVEYRALVARAAGEPECVGVGERTVQRRVRRALDELDEVLVLVPSPDAGRPTAAVCIRGAENAG